MRAAWCALLGCVLAFASPPSQAAGNGADLARKNKCLACHQVDKRRVGPAYQSIAAKYAGQPGARDQLVQSIRQGSLKRWGAIPMPAQHHVSAQDAEALAEWILHLQP